METPFITNQEEQDCNPDYVIAFKFFDKIFEQDERMTEPQIKDLEDDVFRLDLSKQTWNEDSKPPDVRALWNKQQIYDNLKWHVQNILEKKCQLTIIKKQTDEHEMYQLKCDETFLMKEADRIDYRLRFKEGYDEGLSSTYKCQGFAKFEKDKYFKDGQLDKPYAKMTEEEKIFEPHGDSFFRQTDRVRLIYSRINQYLNLPQAAQWGLCRGFVPQQTQQLQEINQNWLSCNPFKKIPLQSVRDYFGEQIALYFTWVERLIFWLIFPSVIGLITSCISAYFGGFEKIGQHDESEEKSFSGLTPSEVVQITNLFYSIIIIVWAVVFLEFWKRKSQHQVMEWGTDNFEEEEEPRPEFVGEKLKNPINDKVERMFSSSTRRKRQFAGLSVACFFIAVTLIIITAIFMYKASVQISDASLDDKKNVAMLTGMLNACQIKLMNFLYQKCAGWMTDWENYRTQTEYNDALYGKIFAFQFINSFTSLYYIAFIKDDLERSVDKRGCNVSCTAELSVQLLMLFVMFIGFNGLEIGIPMIKKIRADRSQQKKERLESEVDMQLPEVEGDYLELMVCFGYLTLFTASLPISPILAFVAIAIEIRVDAYKYGKLTQRPFPTGAADIGIWESVLHFLVLAAVVTNVGLILITDNKFGLTDGGKWGWFIIIEHAVLFIIWIVETCIPDEEERTSDLKKRHKYVIESKYLGIKDDD